jgi:hypothetical protein
MNHHRRETEKQSVQPGRMFPKRPGPLEQFVENELGVRQIRTFGLGGGNGAGIWGTSFPHFGEPGVVASTVMSTISCCWARLRGRRMRQVAPKHGDEVVGGGLTEAAVCGEGLEHGDAMFKESIWARVSIDLVDFPKSCGSGSFFGAEKVSRP